MRRFIECLIPTTICNLRCSYCYLIQEGRRTNEKAFFQYEPSVIKQALTIERLGGTSFISITASGETLSVPELPTIVKSLLENGHFVNITTNGTLTRQLIVLLKETEGYHARLHISFSWHYTELTKFNLTDQFFDNIKKSKESGCSILLQINLVDEYLPYWEEIKRSALQHFDTFPQVALTRKEGRTYQIYSDLTWDEYCNKGNEMDSPLFQFTTRFFMKKRKEYCYAGLWSGKLNLCTGELSGCYGRGIRQNIFEDLTKPIRWMPLGRHCPFKYCFNASHFLSQGIIPELEPLPSYAQLRNREEAQWYCKEMLEFLDAKFTDSNQQLGLLDKIRYEMIYYHERWCHLLERIKKNENNRS